MRINNKNLNRVDIVLDNLEVHSLGPELCINECQLIVNSSARGIIIAGLKMSGGTFKQKVRLSNFHFQKASFTAVHFSGKFSGCDFGVWEPNGYGEIVDCSFYEANLDGCRFLNCDPNRIRFPRWPCFTLTNPQAAREFVLSRYWSSSLFNLLRILIEEDPRCVAICFDGSKLAKKDNVVLSEFKKEILAIPGVVIID